MSLDPASQRILRMALGTALAIAFSQAIGWPLAFVCPVFAVVLLSTPLPAPSLASGIKFVLVLSLSTWAGLLLLPFLEHQRLVGIALLLLALFHSFHFPARGGSPILGMFATVGLCMVATIGSVTIDGMIVVVKGLSLGAIAGMLFVWLAHAILPDPPPDPNRSGIKRPPPPRIPESLAIRSSLRSLLIVLPVTIALLFSSSSASYMVVMLKVATMGQQGQAEQSKALGRSLILSTIIGGIAAVLIWEALSIWPSLLVYSLLIGLTCLILGQKIFAGPGMAPNASTWSYGLLTALIIIAPAVLDTAAGGPASAGFYNRLYLLTLAAVYGSVAVAVFDAFWPASEPRTTTLATT
jgi:hypothetical protein